MNSSYITPAFAQAASERGRRSDVGAGGQRVKRQRALVETARGSLVHIPGLDGLRGVAVVAVVLFHGDFGFARGGFLGVSLFFTLSGFLITSLLLSELDRSQRIAYKRFLSRRARRLLPASWLTIAAVVAVSVLLDSVSPSLRGDVWASLLNVANWRFLAGGVSYSELFSSPSPLLHFWSLAIEEQFYLIFPLVVWALWRAVGRRQAALGWIFATLTIGIGLLPALLRLSVDRAYFGTDIRSAELFGGAALAVFARSPRSGVLLTRLWLRWTFAALGILAAAAAVTLWATVPRSDGSLARGTLLVVCALSVVLIVSTLIPSSPLGWVMKLGPLQWLGRTSYGIYLFHWPVLVWIRSEFELSTVVSFLVASAIFLPLAALSAVGFETPIRRGSVPRRVLRPSALLTAILLLVSPVWLSGHTNRAQDLLASIEEASAARTPAAGLSRPAGTPETTSPRPAPQATPTPPVPVMSLFGDSIALTMGLTVDRWIDAEHKVVRGWGSAVLGCGLLPGGTFTGRGKEKLPDECSKWPQQWREVVAAAHTDLAVVMSCQWETVDRQLPGTGRTERLGDESYDWKVAGAYENAVEVLTTAGSKLVVFAECPRFSQTVGVKTISAGLRTSRDPARVQRLNEIMAAVAANHPTNVRVLGWYAQMDGRVDDAAIRPDGSHYDWRVDTGIGAEFGSAVITVWDKWWREQHSEGPR